MKVYISGKVTGLPPHEVAAKFEAAEKQLIARGYTVINPVKVVNDPQANWCEAMRKCIAALMDANYVYALPCAKDSKGAKIEIDIAWHIAAVVFYDIKSLPPVDGSPTQIALAIASGIIDSIPQRHGEVV